MPFSWAGRGGEGRGAFLLLQSLLGWPWGECHVVSCGSSERGLIRDDKARAALNVGLKVWAPLLLGIVPDFEGLGQ